MTRTPIQRALDALEGVSVGDAFGEQFFGHELKIAEMIGARREPPGTWPWTDDTTMALSIVAVLDRHGSIDQTALAGAFGAAYRHDPHRGYGPGMHRLLRDYHSGDEWRWLASEQFGGQGSFGNGAAMRVAPLGAYFADDLDRVVREATASAEVTHAHREGVAGGIAVAVAAALAADAEILEPDVFLERVMALTPDSEVLSGLRRAARVASSADPVHAAAMLGNGAEVTAQDTVPFCLWIAATRAGDFATALWDTVRALGDRDTTCAIVGGILGARLTHEAIPPVWLERREALPPWVAELRARAASSGDASRDSE